jgi:competence protein ComEA
MKARGTVSVFVALSIILGLSFFTNTADAASAKNPPQIEGKLNINTATASQFSMLQGIGAKSAESIVEYRTKNGNFKSIDDLLNIKGIGNKLLERNRVYLVLEGESTLKKTK